MSLTYSEYNPHDPWTHQEQSTGITEQERKNINVEDFDNQSFFQKIITGFKYEISSAEYMLENGLYKSFIIEGIVFVVFGIVTLFCAIGASVLISVFSYSQNLLFVYIAIGVYCISFIACFLFIGFSPFVLDVYHRLSEKTEKLIMGEQVEMRSGPRCNGSCTKFAIIFILTSFLETFFFTFFALICIVALIIPPVGLILLFLLQAFIRAFRNFKIIFIRKGNYWQLWKFMFSKEIFPFALGIGMGFVCMNKVLSQAIPFVGGFLGHLVTVISATRFFIHYHFVLGRNQFFEKQNIINYNEKV